jgi:hypothetical protein
MNLPTAPYAEQVHSWPTTGRHILATHDDETIVVYQAYRSSIGRFAAEHGFFGGEFGYGRMSWVKPGFLWMMYRSDWGRSEGQEVVLAVRLRRAFFDRLLGEAVFSSFQPDRFADRGAWQAAVQRSDVRLQWDPDHLPTGAPTERRSVQLGLRGAALDAYGRREAVEIQDVTSFVRAQLASRGDPGALLIPEQRVYRPSDPEAVANVGLDLAVDASPT